MSEHRSGVVGLYGRPNTGKSSLFNRLVGQRLAIVSSREQTTRHSLTGVLTTPDCQYAFIDSPGFQLRHRTLLNRSLNRQAGDAAREADVVALVVEALHFEATDRDALRKLPGGRPVVCVVNKIDRVRPHSRLLPFLQEVAAEHDFAALVPVSASTGRNLPELLSVLRGLLPVGPQLYPADHLTDRDERFFAAELLREKVFRLLGEELPYRCETRIDSFREEGRLRRIEATLWVDRDSLKPIVLGAGGAMLKRISTDARKDMERMFGGKVFLRVWVKVKRRWSEDERVMRELGYA